MWPVSDENASVRGRSGPDKGLPAVRAYLRVSGTSGPLTSEYEISLDIRNYCTFNAPLLMLMYAYISINNEGKE